MPRGLEPADQRVEQLDLVIGERGGGLVHDQDAGVERERLDDLDHLLLRDAQLADPVGRPHRLRADGGEQLGRALAHRPAVDQPAAQRLAAEEHVLGDRALGQQVELLVDDADAGGLGGARAVQRDRLTADPQRARVGLVDA